MHRSLFTDWKIALFFALGISACVGAFFADGGGHEQLEASAQQIREKRSNPYRDDAQQAAPVAAPSAAAPAPTQAPVEVEDEPAFGEPMFDPVGDDEPKPAAKQAPKPAAATEEAEL